MREIFTGSLLRILNVLFVAVMLL